MRQYKFNIDVGPDRLSLQAMEKNNKESLREYAQRWSEVAAQVNPPMLEKEMITLFSNTFKAPYFCCYLIFDPFFNNFSKKKIKKKIRVYMWR
jgi:hypothetical protein